MSLAGDRRASAPLPSASLPSAAPPAPPAPSPPCSPPPARALPRAVEHGRDVLGDAAQSTTREYVVTNGAGSYASASLAGTLTRSYHGLLIAALHPPLGRTLLVSALDEVVTYLGSSSCLAPHTFAARDVVSSAPAPARSAGRVEAAVVSTSAAEARERRLARASRGAARGAAPAPAAAELLERFRLDGTTPVFTYAIADAVLEKRVWLKRGADAVYVRYKLVRASRPLSLSIDAIVNHRGHHARTEAARPGFDHDVHRVDQYVLVDFAAGGARTRLALASSRGQMKVAQTWVSGGALERERERGLPSNDDHLHAATISVDLLPGSSVTVVAAVVPDGDGAAAGARAVRLPAHLAALDGDAELAARRAYEARLLGRFHTARGGRGRMEHRAQVEQLVLAADQFVVRRRAGRSVIAGWHWFQDYSRDSFIALPGLALTCGRPDVARDVLATWAGFVSEGMLPNRFPECGDKPADADYNTADGTLWYFEAVRAYYAATHDAALLRELFPLLESVVAHHVAGTRFGIRQDPADGLLAAGADCVALTWMDAVCGAEVFTPRRGKPVELSALWFNALSSMSIFAADLSLPDRERHYSAMADATEAGFRRFWSDDTGHCHDVLDTPSGPDPTLRPNQLLAVSLQWSPLSTEQHMSIVSACAQHLYASHGLRTLPPTAPRYRGSYEGGVYPRDAAYHNGTSWAWLLGPFVTAHLRAYGDRRAARAYLAPVLATLPAAGQGTLSEVFDGDAPFRPRGCVAQAWSVAEVLRAYAATEPPRETRGAQ